MFQDSGQHMGWQRGAEDLFDPCTDSQDTGQWMTVWDAGGVLVPLVPEWSRSKTHLYEGKDVDSRGLYHPLDEELCHKYSMKMESGFILLLIRINE